MSVQLNSIFAKIKSIEHAKKIVWNSSIFFLIISVLVSGIAIVFAPVLLILPVIILILTVILYLNESRIAAIGLSIYFVINMIPQLGNLIYVQGNFGSAIGAIIPLLVALRVAQATFVIHGKFRPEKPRSP